MTLRTLYVLTVIGIILVAADPSVTLAQHEALSGQAVVAPELFDKYVGYYRLGPHVAVRVFREGNQFYLSTVGTQQKREIVAQTQQRFAVDKLPVTISFIPDPNGAVSAATINQGGRDIIAPRITETAAQALAASPTMPTPIPHTWAVMAGVTIHGLTQAPSGSIDYWPCFSPDGKRVLFSRSVDAGKTWSLYTVPAAGGKASQFVRLPVSATRASWSIHGEIAFNGDAGNASQLWVAGSDGQDVHAIATPGVTVPSYPSWYPDGKRITLSDAVSNIIYRTALDTGSPVPFTHQDQVLAGMSSVSPDGDWIAFAGQKNSGQVYNQNDNQIWLANGAGEARPVDSGPGRTPSWSPDGKRIVFESDRGSPNGFYAIFIINRNGGGLTQVTDYEMNAGHPIFSPDGKHIVFAVGTPQANSGIDVADLPE